MRTRRLRPHFRSLRLCEFLDFRSFLLQSADLSHGLHLRSGRVGRGANQIADFQLRCAALRIERGIVEVPLRRSRLPDELRKVASVTGSRPDELLTAVDVVRCSGDRCVRHEVDGHTKTV
jgi:hypothetical protein